MASGKSVTESSIHSFPWTFYFEFSIVMLFLNLSIFVLGSLEVKWTDNVT